MYKKNRNAGRAVKCENFMEASWNSQGRHRLISSCSKTPPRYHLFMRHDVVTRVLNNVIFREGNPKDREIRTYNMVGTIATQIERNTGGLY